MQFNNKPPVVDIESDNQNGEIEEGSYNEGVSVFFAFIDVLGFSQSFDDEKQRNKGKKADVIAKKYKEVFEYFFKLLNNTNFYKQETNNVCYAGQTSDSLYFYTDDKLILKGFIKFYLNFSLYAMTQDVFFRGGLAKGDLFINSNKYQFYGDSVINAYRLESVIAKKPAVYVDSECYDIISKDDELKECLERDHLRHYINPFAGLKIDNSSFLNTRGLSIKRNGDPDDILKCISNNKKAFEFNVNVYEKYSCLEQILKKEMNKERE